MADTTVSVDYLINNTTHDTMFSSNPAESSVLQNSGWTCYATLIQPSISTNPVYRLYNPTRNWHFFTNNPSEESALASTGWNYEGIAFYGADYGTIAVTRYYNTSTQAHSWTVPGLNTYNDLVYYPSNTWKYEGIAWAALSETVHINTVVTA